MSVDALLKRSGSGFLVGSMPWPRVDWAEYINGVAI